MDGYTDFIFVNRFGECQHQGTLNKAIRRIIRDGVKLGTYTSQWFANAVLQPLDQLIRESGLCKHYARYMDNLTTFGPNKRKLKKKGE